MTNSNVVDSLVLVANSGDGSISVFRSDGSALTRLAVTEDVPGCSNFVIDASRDLVYASVKGERPGILTLALDRETGSLTPVSHTALTRGAMNYLALTRDGGALLGAAYGAGYGILCPVTDGVVGDPTSIVEYPNLHSVTASSDGKFAYFVSLGADLVAQCAITDDLILQPLGTGTVAAPAGSGARHIILNANEDAAYVMTEFTGEVLQFARDTRTGELRLVEGVPAFDATKGLTQGIFGADPIALRSIWGADVHWGADGAYLWASERSESTLAALPVAADGTLGAPERLTVTEKQPRGFALSADGRFLVAAGEESTTVSLYAVHGDALDLLDRAETGNGANWVRFL